MGAILVTGGAGYIGSHVVQSLIEKNDYDIIVYDDLSTGHKDAVHPKATFIEGDIRDLKLLSETFTKYPIQAVMHFAAKTSVPESIAQPFLYYDHNTTGTLNLLQATCSHQVKQFIFSSTAAVYGFPQSATIDESAPTEPTNPYGYSKLVAERMVADFAKAYPLHYVILRYFNVAGADPKGRLGQRSTKAEHLIKVALDTANGKRAQLPIFGNQYPTKDGTCIRDFIHVSDIANAHVAALQYLVDHHTSTILNCGYGQGYSVKEVIQTLEKIVGRAIPAVISQPRPGDIPEVIANNQKICHTLDWRPQYNDIRFMIQTAYDWEKNVDQNPREHQVSSS